MIDPVGQAALLQWVTSFADTVSSEAPTSLSKLSDGVFLSSLMHQIGPQYLSGTTTSTEPTSKILQGLLSAIDSFYLEELGVISDAQSQVDVNAMANGDASESDVASFVELTLGCAVQCEDKGTYIRPIMEMDEAHQAVMMQMIQDLMHRFPAASPPSPKRSTSNDKQQELQIKELQVQVSKLQTLNKTLVEEKQELVLAEERNREAVDASRREQNDKRVKATKMQHMSASKIQEMEITLKEKEEEIAMLRGQHGSRSEELEEEVRRQADELDISRSKIAQMGKLESSLAKYKAKLEEASSLRQQMKDLESQNEEYLDKILDLESTVKTIGTLKATVEKYKDKVVDLETANVQAKSNLSVRDHKIQQLQEELENSLAGREFLEEQLEGTRTELEQLKGETDGGPFKGSSDEIGFGESVATLREKIARLERQNKAYRESPSDEPNVETAVLENQLDDALRIKKKMEENNVALNLEVQSLKSEIEALKKHVDISDATETLSVQLSEKENEVQALKAELEKNKAHGHSLESMKDDAEVASSATIVELTSRLKGKESEINQLNADKEKLENYTRKTLHAVQSKYMVALGAHKNQLKERDERLELLETRLKETQTLQKREEALLMSAFYEVGSEMQRRSLMPNTAKQQQSQHQPSSWIARQRSQERSKRGISS